MHISKLHVYSAVSACLALHVLFEEQNERKLVHFRVSHWMLLRWIKNQVSVELNLGEESKQLWALCVCDELILLPVWVGRRNLTHYPVLKWLGPFHDDFTSLYVVSDVLFLLSVLNTCVRTIKSVHTCGQAEVSAVRLCGRESVRTRMWSRKETLRRSWRRPR